MQESKPLQAARRESGAHRGSGSTRIGYGVNGRLSPGTS